MRIKAILHGNSKLQKLTEQYRGAFLFLYGLELYNLPFELDNLIM